jgi:uncharacterized tellurite resistance protein B-like protein
MESPSSDDAQARSVHDRQHLLRDLALIYLTLAHGTDEDLTDDEVDTIADELHEWQEEMRQESVLSAIKGALALYEREDALDQVNAAIQGVHERLSEEDRQLILDDLVEIAMADGRYMHEESTFIGELADAWDVSAGEEDRGHWASSAWTVLQNEGPAESWTPVHDLALIYLTLAYETDKDLDEDEVDAITAKISEWIPGAENEDVLGVVREVMETYVQGPRRRVFAESVDAVGEVVPQHQHEALLADLRYVAEADGVILDAERRMIRDLADAWGLPAEEA